MKNNVQAYRVRQCIPLQGEKAACADALFAPLARIDDCLVLTEGGRIVFLGKYSPKAVPAGLDVTDLTAMGEVLVPAVINAHTHIQLAHTAGKTLWGEGFVPWLKSLIPLLSLPFEQESVTQSVMNMRDVGTAFFADYTNTGLALVAHAAQSGLQTDIEVLHLAEWFGFADLWHAESGLPQRVREVLAKQSVHQTQSSIAPCGHALYSTDSSILQRVHAWCQNAGQPFSMHLAEFPEEAQALSTGRGALVDLYTPVVLSKDWRAPGLNPVPYAQSLGLLGSNTLAIHCVHCSDTDIEILAQAGVTVCLCPRSNANLAVGTAPLKKLAKAHIYLCLGTDGLSSNEDLNVWQDAEYLRDKHDFPLEALLRMLTVNAATIMRRHKGGQSARPHLGTLEVGSKAVWTFLPDGWGN